MSRRGAILEGYRVPDLTNPINPVDAQRMVSQERMHDKELAQQQQQHQGKRKEDRDKELADMYKPNATTSGTIYDPTGLKATQDLLTKAQELAKSNPNMSAAEIQATLAPESNKIAQYYQKAKTIKENNKIANEGLNKLGGYNTSEIDLKAQQLALLDPKTGKIRDDIDSIDETQPWWKKAIETYPMETTTNEGLHQYVETAKTNTTTVGVKRIDKNRGMVSDKLELTIPPFMQIEKDDKNNPVLDANGNYSLEPKYETLPNKTKILDYDTFKDIKNNKPSYYQRLMGEVSNYIKTNNDESDDNIPLNSTEAENIARMLAYQDIKPIWGNRGVKRYEEQKQPPAPRITINNGSGKGSGDVTINDVYGNVEKKVNADIENLGNENNTVYTRVNALGTDAAGIIAKTANDLKPDAKLGVDNLFLHKDKDGKIDIYQTATDDNGNEKVIVEEKYKIGTLPRVGTNLKVQPNSKAKVEVVKQGNKTEQPKQGKVHKAKMADGTIITSTDGVTWFDSKGKKIQ